MSLSLTTRLLILVALVLLGGLLALFYGFIAQRMDPPWLVIALVHSVAAVLLWPWRLRLRLPVRRGLIAFLPALVVVLGSVALGLVSRLVVTDAPPWTVTWDWRLAAFVLWIPLVEELVFRFGLAGWLRQKWGLFWSVYGSALVFALAHNTGGWHQLGIPLGPLLLGLATSWLYVVSGRLTAAIALHAACNASGWIFASLDARWLTWLEAFYLTV